MSPQQDNVRSWLRNHGPVWLAASLGLAAAALILLAAQPRIGEAHVALVLLLVVLAASAAGGRTLGMSISVAAFLVFDWFFLPPYNTLVVRNPFDWLVLVVFLITSIVAAQLLYRARSERAAVERAEASKEADKLKDALLASLSHDLRTPLTAIKALAHEMQPLGDERALIIEEQADRLNRLVTDLLDVGRLNAGALRLDIQLNAVDDLLGAVVQQTSGRSDQDRLKVSLDDPATISFGRFDFVHSLRILGNLIDNAFKYSPANAPIEVTGGVEGAFVVFRVKDRGTGVAVSERDRVFTPFYHIPGKSGDGQSTGLGLSIARGLAEAQDGTLAYSERDGGGAVFELRLPSASP
jgi:two-component system sensor histidine kinase KdpD